MDSMPVQTRSFSPCLGQALEEKQHRIVGERSERRASRIKVLVVDDHAAVRRGLATFLAAFEDLQLVGEAANGEEAVELCARVHPDVVVMDLVMPGMSGAQATCAIHSRWPSIRVVALTSFQEADLMQEALNAGAACCLLKNVSADELADTIRGVYERPNSPPNGNGNGHGPDPCRQPVPVLDRELRPREREVLAMMVKGLSYPEIAERLTVNALTAKFHVSNVLYKLGVTSRSEAIALALENHLVG